MIKPTESPSPKSSITTDDNTSDEEASNIDYDAGSSNSASSDWETIDEDISDEEVTKNEQKTASTATNKEVASDETNKPTNSEVIIVEETSDEEATNETNGSNINGCAAVDDTSYDAKTKSTTTDDVTIDDVKTKSATKDDVQTKSATTDDEESDDEIKYDQPIIPNELLEYIDQEAEKLNNDISATHCLLKYTFDKFFRPVLREYISAAYHLQARTVDRKAGKVEIYKPGIKVKQVDFTPETASLLTECHLKLSNNPENNMPYHSMDMAVFINNYDKLGRLTVKPILSELKINPDIIKWRKELPIWQHRLEIMEHIIKNQVSIISGGPGVGKSTQIPQYVLEYMTSCEKPSNIIFIHPYRVVAMTMAKRIAYERGEEIGGTIGYKVQNRDNLSGGTHVTFCTSEIFMRSLDQEGFFDSITHVIVDNIDLRDKYTDFTLLCLRESLLDYPDIRLILLSSSENNSLFVNYFTAAPILNIPAPNANKPVTEFFMNDIFRLTDRQPLEKDKMRLERKYPAFKTEKRGAEFDCDNSFDLMTFKDLIRYICLHKPMGGIIIYLPSYEDIKDLQELIMGDVEFLSIEYDIYFLHRMFDVSSQASIFSDNGRRKIILSTTLAESYFFVDDIHYVIDSGMVWQANFVAGERLSNVTLNSISREASDRRANRMRKNEDNLLECYRMYTFAEYQKIRDSDAAEILTAPLQDLFLLIKKLIPEQFIKNILALCPQQPGEAVRQFTVFNLIRIRAFKHNETMTPWGELMGHFAMDPRLTKMLIYGLALKCIEPIITIVAFLCMRGPCTAPTLPGDEAVKANAQRDYSFSQTSDHLSLIQLFAKWQNLETSDEKRQFCEKNAVRHGMMELVTMKRYDIKQQLHRYGYLKKAPELSEMERNERGRSWPVIRACLAAGFSPQFAFVDSDGTIHSNWSYEQEISKHSLAYRKKLDWQWIIYEIGAIERVITNLTPVNPLTLLLFGTNCSHETKGLIMAEGNPIGDKQLILDTWACFENNQNVVSAIVRIREYIESCMLFYVAVPISFKNTDAVTAFKYICDALSEDDILGQIHVPWFVQKMPFLQRVKVNYSKQPFVIPRCQKVDCPREFFFEPIVSAYYPLPHKSHLQQVNIHRPKALIELITNVKKVDCLLIDVTPKE